MINILEYSDITFPKDFLWGVSTAGQQIEGNNNSFYDDKEIAPKFAYGGVPIKWQDVHVIAMKCTKKISHY